jgi:hypothetical protein
MMDKRKIALEQGRSVSADGNYDDLFVTKRNHRGILHWMNERSFGWLCTLCICLCTHTYNQLRIGNESNQGLICLAFLVVLVLYAVASQIIF